MPKVPAFWSTVTQTHSLLWSRSRSQASDTALVLSLATVDLTGELDVAGLHGPPVGLGRRLIDAALRDVLKVRQDLHGALEGLGSDHRVRLEQPPDLDRQTLDRFQDR